VTTHNTTRLKISVIMVDGSFRERYDSIDFMARQDLAPQDYELIWVEYYDTTSPDLQRRIDARPGFRSIALGRSGTYHSSYCFNRGIAEARGELVVIPDADVIAEPGFLNAVWQDHQASDRLVTYYHRYNEPKDKHLDTINLEHLRRVCALTNPANHGACLGVRRDWLDAINGYEQSPIFATGFHANDKDVYARLCSLGLMVRWNPEVKLFHPWHDMTGEVTPHYTPQLDVISWRGRTLSTLPFSGMDPVRNTTPPAGYIEAEKWLASLDQPRWKRAAGKLAARFGYQTTPTRKAA
jgi:Glycosyl transferase family 2